MKALIYCRVSSQRQVDEGHGNDSQEKRCKDRAASKGVPVEKVFPDNGISGSLFERPAMHDLLKYIDEHPLENYLVIFDDLSRFARDVAVHIKLKAEFMSRGVQLECLNFNFDDSDESEMAELMLAVSNQYQRKANRRQVIQKMKARIERGYWPFCLPLGLINKKDPIHGKIAVSREPYASIFKEAIEKFADGLLITPQEVRAFVNSEFKQHGIERKLAKSTVDTMLREILYAGYVQYDDWKIPLMKGQHEGFITLQTYNIVQDRLVGRSKPWQRRDYSSDFPLRPHIPCAACGTPITGSWNTGRSGTKYPNYKCRRQKGKCIYAQKSIPKSKIEPEFEELLITVNPGDEVFDLAGDVLQERWNERLTKHSQSRRQLQEELKQLSDDITWYVQRAKKTRDEEMIETYEEEIKKNKANKKEIEKKLAKECYTSEEFGTASETVIGTLKEPLSMWKSDDYNDKRTILYMYFEGQLQYDYKEGFGTADLAYPVKLIASIGQAKNGDVEMSGSEPESENVIKKHLQA